MAWPLPVRHTGGAAQWPQYATLQHAGGQTNCNCGPARQAAQAAQADEAASIRRDSGDAASALARDCASLAEEALALGALSQQAARATALSRHHAVMLSGYYAGMRLYWQAVMQVCCYAITPADHPAAQGEHMLPARSISRALPCVIPSSPTSRSLKA